MDASRESLASHENGSAFARDVLEALPAGVLLYDDAGAVRFANRRARTILGIEPAGAASGSVMELLDCIPHEMETANEGGVLFTSHGERRRQLGFRVGTAHAGELEHHLLLFQDITQRESRKRERQRHLILSSVTHLFPAMAHEIKNPLAVIRGVVDVLMRSIHDVEQRRDLETIVEEVGRMTFLVDRMGLVNERLVAPGHQSDMVSVVRKALTLIKTRAGAVGVDVEYRGPDELWAPVHPELMQTILGNLLNNALDASPNDSVIRVNASRVDGALELSVRDSGAGMTQTELEHATDLFYSTKGSSGIGLALIRDIVERAGGSLSISSEEGVGTTVAIRLKVEGP